MKTSNSKTKAHAKAFAFLGAAFVLLIALIFTGCKQPASSSGGSGGGGTSSGGGGTGGSGGLIPSTAFTQVAYGTNGADLKDWLTNTASPTEINRIEVTGVPSAALAGTASGAGALGTVLKESGKKVALKLPAQTPTPSLKNGFKGCTKLVSVQLEYAYEAGKFDNAFAGCTGLGKGSITVPPDQLQAYQAAAAAMGVPADCFVPSSIEGVWRFISVQDQGQPLKTFPHDPGDGSQTQPYYCFNQGKMYHALKFSGYPTGSPQENGIFQMPGNWGRPYIFQDNMIMNFNVTFNGNEMTLEEPGSVILKMERVSNPTAEQILAAKPMGGSQPQTVTIKFDESKIEVWKSGSRVHDGDTVTEGDWLFFEAKNLPPGQKVDKWKVNTKELDSHLYEVKTSDAQLDGSITVSYTLKTQTAVTVKFDESEIRVTKNGPGPVQDGDSVYQGDRLFFSVKNLPSGQQIEKWKVNTQELDYGVYQVNAADAVTEGSAKVIRVTYTAKPGVNPVIVKFDPTLVGVYDAMSGTDLQFGQTVYEGTKLAFGDKAFVPGTKKWFVNAKEANAHELYTVNTADAIYENGERVIRIRLTVQDPKTLTVQFNSAEIECKTFNGATSTSINPGFQGPAYTYVILKAKIPEGKSVKHWTVNGIMIPTSVGAEWLEGQANPDFATPQGVMTISVVFE